eukprot:237511_1
MSSFISINNLYRNTEDLFNQFNIQGIDYSPTNYQIDSQTNSCLAHYQDWFEQEVNTNARLVQKKQFDTDLFLDYCIENGYITLEISPYFIFVIHFVSSESTVHCLVSDPITKATTDFKLEIEARPLNPIELRPQIELEEIEEEEKQEEEEEFAGATAICTAAHREFIGNLEIDHYYYLQFDYQLRSS